MTTKRPAEARREESPGGLPERSRETGCREAILRLELVPRLQAIVDELRLLDADTVDVPYILALGLLDDVEGAL